MEKSASLESNIRWKVKATINVRPVSVLRHARPLRDEGTLKDGSVVANQIAIDPDAVCASRFRFSEPDVAVVGVPYSLSGNRVAVVHSKGVNRAPFIKGLITERSGRQTLRTNSHGSSETDVTA